jgi:hypothetical protein
MIMGDENRKYIEDGFPLRYQWKCYPERVFTASSCRKYRAMHSVGHS